MQKILYLLLTIFIFSSCVKENVETPDFDVATTTLNYKVGDTITFSFSGNPDNISFYSGEPGLNYAFRNRTTATDNDLQIEFKSLVQFGLIYQNLKLLVSNNFSGIADTTNVKAATWTDISSSAVFSSGADSVPSGIISLKSYKNPTNPATPIYVAFKYADYKKTQGQNRWVIRTFGANNVSPDGIVTPLAVMSTASWQAVNFKNTAAVWSITAAQLLMYGGTSAADDNDDWVISEGFDATLIKPTVGVALKNISTTLTQYKYVYKKAGTYTAVFEASAVRYNGDKRIAKEIVLNIAP